MQKRIVSCDWGTSTFRIRLVDSVGGEVLCERHTWEGISVLDQSRESLGLLPEERATYLCRYIDGQLESLSEAPYRAAMEALHPGHPAVYVPVSQMARAFAVVHGQLFQTMFLGSSRGG
ncbi:MAG: 2-dehydro-3-deoxygalactonokinase [Bacteroidetes bacterium]|nr:2-dehydro-3-deoxygalactonokinase [Bacteroidota bacterium]